MTPHLKGYMVKKTNIIALSIVTTLMLTLGVDATDYRKTHPQAWTTNNVNTAIEKLYGITNAQKDSRVVIKAPNVASNGGSIPVTVSTYIAAKSLAIFQDANPSALVMVYTVHEGSIPSYSLKLKMQTSGNIVVVVEGKDGKFYKNTYHVEVALGGCEGSCGSAVSPYQMKSSSARHAFQRVDTKKVREEYKMFGENSFKEVASSALSTFSTDVDTASYTNIRSYILDRQMLPSKDAVRIEEMMNYFSYDYHEPSDDKPFYINTHVSPSIWNDDTHIIQIGLQTKKVDISVLPASNLVFVLDVSGSMKRPESLPLLMKSLKLLTKQLRAKDRVSIVVYAGASGLVLDRARGDEKARIVAAIEKLKAGGSTAGGAGIKLAYEVAQKSFIKGGNNRIILATDGDFNVGLSTERELIELIEEKRKSGIFLSVLGFGRGNTKDMQMEALSNHGNGNYAYIDTLLEAKKVLVTQMSGTLYTVAKDVKIQVEFNPAKVHSYRLIGYVNRLLKNEDFNNDKVDAGEVGMGHSVTALYEIKLAKEGRTSKVDALQYQEVKLSQSDNLATVKIRYKKPDGNVSTLQSKGIKIGANDIVDKDNTFVQAVAGYGMLLRDSKYKNNVSYTTLIAKAKEGKGADEEGYRAEFIKILESSELLQK